MYETAVTLPFAVGTDCVERSGLPGMLTVKPSPLERLEVLRGFASARGEDERDQHGESREREL